MLSNIFRSQYRLLLLGFLSLVLIDSCEELEPVNPADPAFMLDPPTLLSVEAITDTHMEIVWRNNEEHTKEFVVQRKSGSGAFSIIGTFEKNILTFLDTACVLGIEYHYVVQSKVESNRSANSNTLKKATIFPGPSSLIVIGVSDESVRVTWVDNTTYESGFKIERDAGGGFSEVGIVAEDVTEYTDTGLTFGQSYSYRVAAYSSANTSNWTTITAATEFPAPSNLSASSVSDSELLLTWTDNTTYETGFRIERDAGSGFTEIGTVEANVSEYADTGLIYGQSYSYRVAAYSSVNTSNWTTITAATEFPAPSNLSATAISDTEIELSWTDNCSFETGYRIERDSGSGFETLVEVVENVTNYTNTGLTLGASYSYRVAAFTSANTSNWTTITAATEFPAPSNLSASSVSDSELLLTWTENTGYETGFKIERDAGSGFTEIGTVPSDVTEYTDTGLTVGQDYSYRVAAYTSANISSWATITAATEFPAPSNLSASSVSESELLLTWTDNTTYESGFRIERDDGSGFAELETVLSDVTEYTDTGLTVGQDYSYRVAAYTSANTSSWATITAATELRAPSDLSAIAISDSEIELSWTDNTTYESGFRIERDAGSGFSEIGTVSSDVTEFTDSGLIYGQSYNYRVAAFTTMNTSDYSNEVSVTIDGPVTDIDGNVYEVVTIGSQVWMAENLKVTHYRDGTAISHLASDGDWTTTSSGAYCFYDNNSSNGDTYGALYNWYAVSDSRNIAPEGWHVPSDDEWKELEMALGMSQSEADVNGWRGTNEGSKLAGNAALWIDGALENDPEFGTSGFTALPGGWRVYYLGSYNNMGDYAYFWSATENNSTTAWYRTLHWSTLDVLRYLDYKRDGFSIRCLRD